MTCSRLTSRWKRFGKYDQSPTAARMGSTTPRLSQHKVKIPTTLVSADNEAAVCLYLQAGRMFELQSFEDALVPLRQNAVA